MRAILVLVLVTLAGCPPPVYDDKADDSTDDSADDSAADDSGDGPS